MKCCKSALGATGTLLVAGLSLPALAADVDLSSISWTAVGAAGLIYGDATVPESPLGNARFGYVTTAGGEFNVSPLVLKTDGKGNEMANNGSTVRSSAFSASADDVLSLQFNYVSTDGRGYDDYAWARLIDTDTNQTAAWLFTARSTNSARGNVVPGDVLKRQVDGNAPDELDAVLDNGNSIGFDVASTVWAPLDTWSGYCWDDANTCGPTGWIQSEYKVARNGTYALEIGVVNWGDTLFDSAMAFDFGAIAPANFSNVTLIDNGPTPPVPEPSTWAMLVAGAGVLGWGVRRRARMV